MSGTGSVYLGQKWVSWGKFVGAGLTALAAFHTGFHVPYAWQHKIPSRYAYRNPVGPDPADIIAASVAALHAKVDELGPERVAAFYVEPLQGSGGYCPANRLEEACRSLGIHFVVDVVNTGFGRTGPLFASSEEGLRPDFMTTAKRLTSGYLPMGDLFMATSVFETIASALGHGYTSSGTTPLPSAAAARIFDQAYQNRLIVRAFANGVLGFAPPLCCTAADIAALLEPVKITLDETLDDADIRAALTA